MGDQVLGHSSRRERAGRKEDSQQGVDFGRQVKREGVPGSREGSAVSKPAARLTDEDRELSVEF